jgi:hypothetical protein
MHLVCIFAAELHKVVAASILPNIAVMRLSYHHGTKETQDFFPHVSIYSGKMEKYGHKNTCKNTSSSTLDGEVHMLIS